MAVGHCVWLVNCELGCELGGNRGLIPIVIVIVIDCHLLPLFFLKSGTLIFVLLGIIITEGRFHSGFALGSLCLRSWFALAPLLRVEGKSIQNGMKETSESKINLSDESIFFRIFAKIFAYGFT